VDEHIRNAMVSLYPRLRRFATTLTGSVQDGDDLVHQACERALSKTAQWRPGTRLDSWLYRIIHNRWADERRSAWRRTRAPIEEAQEEIGEDGEAHALAKLTLNAVYRELSRLPVEQRAVLTLVCVDGLTYKETAEVLGVPIGTVMSRLARGRITLAERLERHTGALQDNVRKLW